MMEKQRTRLPQTHSAPGSCGTSLEILAKKFLGAAISVLMQLLWARMRSVDRAGSVRAGQFYEKLSICFRKT